MIEPNKIYESNNNINISNEYYIDLNSNKNPYSIYNDQLSKRSNYNFDDSNLLSNSINSILIKNNNSSTNLIYHKKTLNSVCRINKINKSELSVNTDNNDKHENKDNIGLSLNEYLKEEIKNMKFDYNTKVNNIYKNISNNTEETKVNTLDINNNLINETPISSYRNYFNTKAKKNKNLNETQKLNKNISSNKLKKYNMYKSYLNLSNINKSNKNTINNSIKKEDKILKKKLSYNEIFKPNTNKEKINKKTLNKTNLIKNIEFISLKNYSKKSVSKSSLSLNKYLDTNSSYRKTKCKESYNSKKILNISFNDKQIKICNNKKYISNNNTINKSNHNNNLTLNQKNKKINLKQTNIVDNKLLKGYKTTKNDKKVRIKKIDFLPKPKGGFRNDKEENQLFNLNKDLDRLIKENNLIKEKTNKKFRFCKSIKKNIYKNININDFSKDFFIIPKQYSSNIKLS